MSANPTAIPICVRLVSYSTHEFPRTCSTICGGECKYIRGMLEIVKDRFEPYYNYYEPGKVEVLYESPGASNCAQLLADFVIRKFLDNGNTLSRDPDQHYTRLHFRMDKWDDVRKTTLESLPYLLGNTSTHSPLLNDLIARDDELHRENAALMEAKRKLDEIVKITKK